MTLEYGDTPGVSASLACSLFAAARRQLPVSRCPARRPPREPSSTLEHDHGHVQDPPGVHGDGLPSGGADPATA